MVLDHIFSIVRLSQIVLFVLCVLNACCLSVGSETILPNEIYSRQTTCAHGGVGYVNIKDINLDQKQEYSRIRRGESDNNQQYTFILCKGTTFDASLEPLEVLINGSKFSCGESVKKNQGTNDCIISGGREQIIFGKDMTILATFDDIIFEHFTRSSIRAEATASSKATFRKCEWRNFDAHSICNVDSQHVEIFDATITNGIGKSLFINIGGEIYLSHVSVSSIDASTVVTTSQQGSSIIEYCTFTTSYFNHVMLVFGHGILTIRRSNLFEMTYLGHIFKIVDSYSSMVFTAADLLDGIVETSMGDSEIATASVKFSRFLPYSSAQKTFLSPEKIEDDRSLEASDDANIVSVAIALDASINLKKKYLIENEDLSRQVLENTQDGYFSVFYMYLETA